MRFRFVVGFLVLAVCFLTYGAETAATPAASDKTAPAAVVTQETAKAVAAPEPAAAPVAEPAEAAPAPVPEQKPAEAATEAAPAPAAEQKTAEAEADDAKEEKDDDADETEKPWGLNVTVDGVTKYLWRGWNLHDNFAVQPSAEFSYKNFTVGAWGSLNMGYDDIETSFGEIDPYIGFAHELGVGELSAGYTLYKTLGDEGTMSHEPYVGVSFDVPLSPSLTYYLGLTSGFDTLSYHYFELGLSYEQEVNEQTAMGFEAAAGYNIAKDYETEEYVKEMTAVNAALCRRRTGTGCAAPSKRNCRRPSGSGSCRRSAGIAPRRSARSRRTGAIAPIPAHKRRCADRPLHVRRPTKPYKNVLPPPAPRSLPARTRR